MSKVAKMADLDEAESNAIVAVLGQVDAIFRPCRDLFAPRWVAAYLDRLALLDGRGISWTGGGNRDASRVLESLVEKRLVRRHKARSQVKTVAVSLTDDGDWLARTLCHHALPDHAIALMRIMADLPAQGGYVLETAICGREYGSPGITGELLQIEDNLAPALARGWVVANASTHLHVWYAITRAGRAAMQSGVSPPEWLPSVTPDQWERFGQIHAEASAAMLAALDSCQRPTGGDIGEVPLPAGGPPDAEPRGKRTAATARRPKNVHGGSN